MAGVDGWRIAAAVGAQWKGACLSGSGWGADWRFCRGSEVLRNRDGGQNSERLVCDVVADLRRSPLRHLTGWPKVLAAEAKWFSRTIKCDAQYHHGAELVRGTK